jgi:hypothetical protein
MENTLQGAAGADTAAAALREPSAVQNQGAAALKLVLAWLAVGIPMLWGIMKALQDTQYLFR